jgi:hypothetical protein
VLQHSENVYAEKNLLFKKTYYYEENNVINPVTASAA